MDHAHKHEEKAFWMDNLQSNNTGTKMHKENMEQLMKSREMYYRKLKQGSNEP